MKILIADDYVEERKLLSSFLKRRSCEVMEASNGVEALQLASTHPPDLIVSEVFMPEMDGYQFLRTVRSDPALRVLPFVVYSSVLANNADQELALSLGADAFIVRPKDPEDLLTELQAILEQRSGRTRMYSRTINRKLEEKVRELEEAKAEIEKYKKLEDQFLHLRKQETVGQLAEIIAHDFNNILTAIIGYGNLVQMQLAKDNPASPYVDQILTAAARGANLTRALLTFGRKTEQRPQAGQLE